MLAAIWIIAAILLALWSLAAWGLHGLLQWLGSTSGELQPLADRIPWSGVLDSWLPGWQELLRLLLEFSASALAWAGGAVPLIAWVVWALG
ncbi:MAG: hypothetical protein WAQ05_19425, partial [Rubrivivax sp.]